MRAFLVVTCQLALVWLASRPCCQAAISSIRVCLSGMLRSRHWDVRTPSSDLTRPDRASYRVLACSCHPKHRPAAAEVQRDALNILLADMFTLYLKTKNFHWHLSGPHLRDYHLMLDEQGEHIFATTDDIAERVRKIGGTTIRSYRASMSATGCVDLNSPCGLACRT
jgi:hypothetical protein